MVDLKQYHLKNVTFSSLHSKMFLCAKKLCLDKSRERVSSAHNDYNHLGGGGGGWVSARNYSRAIFVHEYKWCGNNIMYHYELGLITGQSG